jgi:hypothetical protein
MTPTRMEQRLGALIVRYRQLGGNYLALNMEPGRWSISAGGGRPAISAVGGTDEEAFSAAEAWIENMERQRSMMQEAG